MIEWGEDAATDLEELLAYIAERNTVAADGVQDRIWSAVTSLSEYPQTGHPADEPGVFIKPLPRITYLVFYTIVGDELHVLHIRHAAIRVSRTRRLNSRAEALSENRWAPNNRTCHGAVMVLSRTRNAGCVIQFDAKSF